MKTTLLLIIVFALALTVFASSEDEVFDLDESDNVESTPKP